jgi:predicted transposase/invertase (TIGR01784 family)
MNLLNDWAFKYIWSNEKNLIHFLNLLFRGREEIKSIIYLPTEQIKKTEKDRKAVFDVYCKNNRDEMILLEMQNLPQKHFEDRSLYYSTFPIQKQAIRGEWDFELKAVYVIGILNFIPKDRKASEQFIQRIGLINEDTKEVFSTKLNFIYIMLPKFNKMVEELADYLDCWLYILKHSKELESQPEQLHTEIFDELFKDIEIEQLNEEKMKAYSYSELKYEDLYNYTNYAQELGREEGLIEGEKRGEKKGEKRGEKRGKIETTVQISKKLQEMGMSIDEISRATGLTQKQILQIN